MKTRVLTGAAIVAVALPILLFSNYIIYPIAMAFFSLASAYELLKVIGVLNQYSVAVPSYIVSVCMPFCAYFAPRDNSSSCIFILAAGMMIYMLYLFCVMIFRKGGLSYSTVAEIFMLVSYVTVSFTCFVLLRYINKGQFIFFLVFIASWGCDTFAYLTGTFFGKHKLIPEISPKKTIEGALGGIMATMLLFALYGFLVGRFSENTAPRYIALVIYGFILAVVGQIGDLLASAIKREHKIKDYGNLLPGHGGVMDRFDSLLAVSVVLIMLYAVYPPFI